MTCHPYRIRDGRVVIEPPPRKKPPKRQKRRLPQVGEMVKRLRARLERLWRLWIRRQKQQRAAAAGPISFFFRIAGEWALALTVPLAILVAAAQNANVIDLNKAGAALKGAFISSPSGGLTYLEGAETDSAAQTYQR